MIDRPEESVGKWYSSLFGGNTNTLVVDYLGDDWYDMLDVGRTNVNATQGKHQFRFFRDPETARDEIQKLDKRLIRNIFKYGVKGWS